MPADSSPAAQADAHAALLDALEIGKPVVVVGVSAGAPSAIEMALRHGDRVAGLILVVPRLYSPCESVGADASTPSQAVLRLIMSGADLGYWLAMRLARASLVRFLGVPPEVRQRVADADERLHVIGVRRNDRLEHVDGAPVIAHRGMHPPNPQPCLDVVRIRRGNRLELAQRFRVFAGSGQPFGLGARIGRLLGAGGERQAEQGHGHQHVGFLRAPTF